MSKSRHKTDKQMTIFDALRDYYEPVRIEGQLKIIDKLQATIRTAIKQSPLSRHQIAGEMSHLVGESITKEMIDSWTRESDKLNGRPVRHIPAEWLPAFCEATGSIDPLRLMAETLGVFLLPGPDALRIEILKLEEDIRNHQERQQQRIALLEKIKGMAEK